MRQTGLKPSPDGYYRRNLGFIQKGSGAILQPKFCLGRVKRSAVERLERITAIWKRIELDAADAEVRPLWGPLSLQIAKAVSDGQAEYRMERTCRDPYQYARHVEVTAKAYPEIRVMPADEELYRTGKEKEERKRTAVEAVEKVMLEEAERWRATVLETSGNAAKYTDLLGGRTLHQALDNYREWIGREKFDKSENAINDTGVTRQNFVKQLKTYLVPDTPLTALTGFASLDSLFGMIRKRPETHRYKTPMARKSARHLIGELARFFDWLHRSPEWDWRKPADYDTISHRPIELEHDLDAEAKEIPTYTVAQLRLLFHHATPLERLLLMLGLNCAFGADQIGRLKIGEIQEKNQRWYIQRIRRKQKVKGIHRLFGVTVEGVCWAMRGREDQKHAYLVVNGQGHPLWRKAKAGRRCRDIANAWYRLLDRVCEREKQEDREFPRYGFNTLRDTSADMIRKLGGGEVASAHLTHKHQSGDKNLRRYTNVPWKAVFKTQRRLEKKLAKVFDGVERPFFDGKGNKGRKVRKQSPDESASATRSDQPS